MYIWLSYDRRRAKAHKMIVFNIFSESIESFSMSTYGACTLVCRYKSLREATYVLVPLPLLRCVGLATHAVRIAGRARLVEQRQKIWSGIPEGLCHKSLAAQYCPWGLRADIPLYASPRTARPGS